jgi:hypothetical protein
MRWEEYVTHMEEMRNGYKNLVANSKGKNHLENVGVEGRLISKWSLNKYL